MEAKKAMPPDKLAELWNIDPKRAKKCQVESDQFILQKQQNHAFSCVSLNSII
ncbi:hypothetical protein V6Z12_A13G274500 [Gossypium hirsutum]